MAHLLRILALVLVVRRAIAQDGRVEASTVPSSEFFEPSAGAYGGFGKPFPKTFLDGSGTVEAGSGSTLSQAVGQTFTSGENGGEAVVNGRQSLSGTGEEVRGQSQLTGATGVLGGKDFGTFTQGDGSSGFSLFGGGLGNVENSLDLRSTGTDVNTEFFSSNLATGSKGSATGNRFYLGGPGF